MEKPAHKVNNVMDISKEGTLEVRLLNLVKKVADILKEYCLNSSLAGVGYIADARYHYTERIFWLICITLSSLGSYRLISDYRDAFESTAISMVVESVRPQDMTQFPSVAVCEFGYPKQDYPRLEEIMNGLIGNTSIPYNYDVEDFVLRVVFQNLYNSGSLKPYCVDYFDDDSELSCPLNGYEEIANLVRANCTEMFERCEWNDKEFDCCRYFLPMKTTIGKCFVINSIHLISKGSDNWLNMESGWPVGIPSLKLDLHYAAATYILNEEDIPHMILTSLQFIQQPQGYDEIIKLHLENIVNDPEVRYISPEHRMCLFPDEIEKGSAYKFYSYTICVTACLREAQIKTCNCTHYTMVYDDDDKNLSCDYEGLLCLDENELMYPQTTILQPWRTNGLVCRCLPSCNEHEVTVVERSFSVSSEEKNRSVTIGLLSLPSQRYRRQAVKSKLDMVVSIGGILGLFLGASILSAVELVYFFSVRIIGSFHRRANEQTEH